MSNKAYEAITQRVLELLERGVVPWRKPWKAASDAPRSLATGKPYQGINVFVLIATAMVKGYSNPYWVTFRQAKERAVNAARAAGRVIEERSGRKGTYYVEVIDGQEELFRGGVRKGEEGTPVVFWKILEKTERVDGEDKAKKIPFLRYFTVFNVEQCDGIETPELEREREHEPLVAAERIADAYVSSGPQFRLGGDRAAYSPPLDLVMMPRPETFVSAELYYSTLFHELGHSTGHESRLNRREVMDSNLFGSEPYGQEELVAEMSAAFLGAAAGLELELDHTASYLAAWLKAIKADPKLIVHAASKAQKASDLILSALEAEEELNEEEAELAIA